MKILITGAKGMLAQAVKEKFEKKNELILTDVQDLDITNEQAVKDFIARVKPDYIINCAAYTAVDKAEENEELAEKINADGPKNLALAAKENNAILVHISTDYVFPGDLDVEKAYTEEDATGPVTAYGRTKLHGEQAIANNCDKYYIFRTAWLYGEGKNFVRTMLTLSETRDEISVVCDQHGSPTYTEDLTSIIYQAIEKKIPFGIYHSTNQEFTTWSEFTKKIFELSNISTKVNPITSEEYSKQYPTSANRPKNSQLSKNKLLSNGIEIPNWEDALKRYLKKEGRM
ncbi:MAG: dTDP-4-dehydrorhamnose reductase [Clostridia bacterium]|nr:dTDP-4-dehydrorhamnose reductase [Clostridia bacterium]